MSNNKNNTICIISQYFPPDNTGDSIRLVKIVKILKKIGYNVIVVTAFPHYPFGIIPEKYKSKLIFREKWHDVDIIRTYVFPLAHEGLIKKVLTFCSFSASAMLALFYIKESKYVWSFSQKLFSYFTGIIFKFKLKASLLLDVVDIWPEAFVNAGIIKQSNKIIMKILKFLLNFSYNLADHLITLNPAMKRLLIHSTNLNPSKISILPNITYPNKFKPIDNIKHAYINKFVVMYTGNLGINYDFITLLKTAKMLKDYKEIRFVIKATGDQSLKSTILNYIKKNNLNNIHFEEKFLTTKQFTEFLNLADVFVLPLKKCVISDTSFPSKLMDYLSLEKPVIFSGDGYSAYLIKKYKLGVSIEAENPQKLSRAIIDLKNNKDERKRMGKNAREVVFKLFSPRILEMKIKQLLK
ncbi:MAG: glycosyltransferase family 4 protein [Promethearchaeota archaeon]